MAEVTENSTESRGLPLEPAGASHRLQMVMSETSAQRLATLKEMTEAGSYGELVRRALLFLEEFLVCSEIFFDSERETERLTARVQVVLPQKTLERLDRLCHSGGRNLSYSEVVRRALSLYTKAYEDRRHRRSFATGGGIDGRCDVFAAA